MLSENKGKYPNNSSKITRISLTKSRNNNIKTPLNTYFFGNINSPPIPKFEVFGR